MKHVILLIGLLAATPAAALDDPMLKRAEAVLKRQPIIDGHNDYPGALRGSFGEGWWSQDLKADSRTFKRPLMTDITRLHQGRVGGQFWSVYVAATVTGPAAVKQTIEQIDIVRGFVAKYPQDLELAGTAADIRRIHKAGKVASLMGVEGGSQIDNSLPVLRMYHALGVRYMTLTHTKHNDWADSANEPARPQPLSDYGKAVIKEMNRIGMLVDLSHVSPGTMKAVLAVTKAPVIYSHSSARGIADHVRNVPDDVLPLVKAIHSIDSLDLARDVNRIATELGLTAQVYLEVNLAEESTKHGFKVEEVLANLETLHALDRLSIQGLMCIPPYEADPELSRPYFTRLRELRDELEKNGGKPLPLLSMGMSHDFEIAIQEGATLVRVGSALFGERQPKA